MQAKARRTLPAGSSGLHRWLYPFTGGIAIDGQPIFTAVAKLRSDELATIHNGPVDAEVVVLQGRPIGDPVVQQGPFRDEFTRRDPRHHRRVPGHAVRWLVVGLRRAGTPSHGRPICTTRRRHDRAADLTIRGRTVRPPHSPRIAVITGRSP